MPATRAGWCRPGGPTTRKGKARCPGAPPGGRAARCPGNVCVNCALDTVPSYVDVVFSEILPCGSECIPYGENSYRRFYISGNPNVGLRLWLVAQPHELCSWMGWVDPPWDVYVQFYTDSACGAPGGTIAHPINVVTLIADYAALWLTMRSHVSYDWLLGFQCSLPVAPPINCMLPRLFTNQLVCGSSWAVLGHVGVASIVPGV